MKAISLWQPWASLWLTERKKHETRHWQTAHRGWLVVHAAKKFPKNLDDELIEVLEDEFGGHWGIDLPTGAILGAVHLDRIVSTNTGVPAHEDDQACGNWAPDRFGWFASCAVRLAEPIAYRGMQGLFDVPDTAIAPLLDQIRREYPDL